MPIKWDAVAVSKALDEIEKHVNQIYVPLEQAKVVAKQAINLPNLPQYIEQRFRGIIGEVERATGGVSYSGAYPGIFKRLIDRARDDIPKQELERQQGRGKQQLLSF